MGIGNLTFQAEPSGGRRTSYTRSRKRKHDPETTDISAPSTSSSAVICLESDSTHSDSEEDAEVPVPSVVQITNFEKEIDKLCDNDEEDMEIEEDCEDFQDEMTNTEKLLSY